ncbi:Rhodopsin domain-containing protein [Madurella fahalii]|uniref:Rhodopsin domain-containing protein n=1 Tax=Madurella fahalii TaxID=1157608 RepID=A0ABQ0GAV4_9PEZI
MGWTYNTKDLDAPTIGPLITGVASALTFISLVIVCLRTYVRAVLISAFGVDDLIILVTWIATAGFAVVTIVQTKWGLGLQEIHDLPSENIYNFGLLQYMGAPFYITSILGFKLALLFSYLRFVPNGTYRHTIIGVIVAAIMFHLSFLLVQLNLCQPARKQWNPDITYGSCLPGAPFYTSMASITIVFDVTVMFLPFPLLVKLRIQKRKKLVLLGLLCLGLFITIIQIIRIQTIKQLSNYINSAPLILWSAVENNLGILVASVPILVPLVKYYNERSRAASDMQSGRTTGYTRDVGSRYAMQTWKSNKTAYSRMTEPRSVHDAIDLDTFEGHVAKGNRSTESILHDDNNGLPGITKKVEVIITRT